MKKIFVLNIIFLLTLMSSSFAAATSNDASHKVNNKNGENIKYIKATKLIKSAKKLDEKGKIEKAKKKYKKALEYLLKANVEKPMQPDIFNYLGFTSRKLGDYENAKIYYLLGLNIDPLHIGINEYLGELYVVTKRMDLALERLNVLKSCKCEEYKELKELIDNN
jgi:tetratricopeptide (TPR) repeat protein